MAKTVREWQFFFGGEYAEAEEVRKRVAKFFAEDEEAISIQGRKVVLAGNVYGDERFPNGEKIITSEVDRIEKEESKKDDLLSKSRNDTTIIHCAKTSYLVYTKTGSVYQINDANISSVQKSIFAIARNI